MISSLRHCIRLCILTVLMVAKLAWAGSEIRVTFVSPNPPGTGYWQHYDKAMLAAARDLNIDLTIIHSKGLDRFAYMDALEKVNVEETDYVVALLKINVADKLLEKFEGTKVKVITGNLEVPDQHSEAIGLPRQKYKNWIGHVVPDDYHAGRLLAEKLLDGVQRKAGSPAGIIAISGSRDSSVSYLRNRGLTDYIAGKGQFRLEQVLYTDWQYDTVRDKVPLLLKRYPDARVIWCASDEIAQAVLDEIQEIGRAKEYRVGSIDWSQRGLNLYGSHNYVTSIGGHFLEGGIILSLIRDHYDGKDFVNSLGVKVLMRMGGLDESNVPKIKDLIENNNWHKLQFQLISKSFAGDNSVLRSDYQTVLEKIYMK